MAREKVDNKLNVVIGTKAQIEGDTSIPENSIIVVTGEELKADEVDLNEMAYFNYSGRIYGSKYSLFSNAWQDMKYSETVLFDIPLTLAAPNQEMGGMTVDLYVGTNGQLQALYDACVNETISLQIDDVCYVNNAATRYHGDVSGDVSFPIPLYSFGLFGGFTNTSFLIGDLTPLSMGLGLVLAKIANVSIPNNNIVIQQGFEFENESGIIIPNTVTDIDYYAFMDRQSNNQPLVIPNSVTYIGRSAFFDWTANNQPLVIPNSVTYIDFDAFRGWQSNNQPLVIGNSVTIINEGAFYGWTENDQSLVIPNSVTFIGGEAFRNWSSNNQPLVIGNSVTRIEFNAFDGWSSNNKPLVIPNNVTEIGTGAFNGWSLVPYVEIQAITPPTLNDANAFGGQNNAPIYVPDESVEAYKTASYWAALANRIFPISDK